MKGFIWILVIILATIILQPEVTPNLISSSHGNANPMNHATRVALSTKESEELNAGYAVVSRDTPVQNTNTEVGSMGTIECAFSTKCRDGKRQRPNSQRESGDASASISPDGYYVRPIPGSVCTQGLHGTDKSGVDLRASVGTKVIASASGIVDEVGWRGRSGRVVRIKHPNGTITHYGHLSKQLVRVGESVQKGAVIALSGKTGSVTAQHLHFAILGGKNPFCGPGDRFK